MELIRVFEGLGKHDAPIAGGKGASLGEMTQAGIPVPGGFVVLSSAFEQFLEETDLNVEIDSILRGVDTKAMHTIEHASETIQKLILEAKMPEDIATLVGTSFTSLNSPFVAVRSSATAEDSASAAWAGQLDSFLNTTEATLLENVQRCWASLFTPRAIFYRFEQGLNESKISVAVVVQKMVESEVSGIAFSVHPVTEDRNQLIIEAGFGLGEAIVSGQVTPDSYVVGKSPREIIDSNVSTQTRALYLVGEAGGNEWRDITEPTASSQVLTEAQILELSELIIHIENHYGFPCDIEWAYEAEKFYIVQSRPITTLQQTTQISTGTKPRILTIFGHRDFTLGLLEVGLDAESLPLLHLDKQEQTRPYFIAERKNNKDILFIDLAQVERQKEEIYAREVRDVNYIRMILKETEEVCEPILQLLYNPRALSRDEIQVFIPQLRTAWRWYAGLWWAIERIEKDDTFAAIIKETMVFRKKTEKFVPGADDVVRKTIMGLCPTLEKYKEVILLSEVLEDTVPDVSVLEERNTHCLLVDGSVYIGDKIEYILKQCNIALVLHEAAADYSREFCGHIAYRGKYRGMVTLVFTKEQASAFPQGNVLVVSSSTPDLLPAIQKSGAIIADEGGIMSHAAIISRELGVPCIIGTKFATEILKDGDLVEVDADNGVVRVLERANEKLQQTFIKAYTRNFSIIMQEAWFDANKKGLIEKLKLDEYPFDPPYVYFMKDGVEEVWENTQANAWLLSKLVERIKTDDTFFIDTYTRYFERLAQAEEYWKKEMSTVQELMPFLDLMYEGVSDFVVLYGSLMDETISERYKEMATAFREKDAFFAECNTAIWKALNRIYPDLGHLVVYITREELGNGVSVEELLKRDSGFALIPGAFVGPISFEEFAQKFHQFKFEIDKGNQDENGLKGQVAYQGKVRGIVSIVKRRDQIEAFKEGSVVVSPMTTPDMLPAMRKAVAFVTDEGGVTCHAAIIARELKKPCIIGTKIATQVLKDGDLVEVDADNGVVRVLERKEKKEGVINLHDYQRLFQWKGGFSYFLNSFFMRIYTELEAITFFDSSIWQSYIPKLVQERTLKEGQLLYASVDSYQELQDGIGEGYLKLKDQFELVLEKDVITKEEVEACFASVTTYYKFYQKTEFFYTDSAFIAQNTDTITKNNLESFGDLKMRGREQLNIIALIPGCYLDQLLLKIGASRGLVLSDLKNLSMDEVLKIFDSEEVEELIDTARDRELAYFVTQNESVCGEDAKKRVIDFLRERELGESLVGQTVFRAGKITARARVFSLSVTDLSKVGKLVEEMEEGEILIAETTAPEIIEACKKAVAIVTNQGGLLSHAAITSRELKIPCVIGTQYATEVIRTGDLVEMDADNGVVRVLEKAK